MEVGSAAVEMKFRAMSYNIRSGIGMDNQYDLDRIARVIHVSGAEIVGLQEVDVYWDSRSLSQDSIPLLAEKLDMHAFFAPIYELPPNTEGQPDRKFGVALLSRFPILKAFNHMMTRISTQNPGLGPLLMPGFAEIVLDVNGIVLSVFVAHLDYRSDPTVRSIQVQEMLDVLSHSPNAKLLLGDFNARPDAVELSPLYSVLKESWTEVHADDPGFTFPADAPNRKIDFILTSPHIRTVSSEIIPTLASDHWPIIADLHWPRIG